MIEMFKAAGEIPANIIFSKEWVETGKFDTPVEAPSTSFSSTDEVFRFNEEQGKEFIRLFGPYDEGGGADINNLFKQPLPKEVDSAISQYDWEGIYPSKSNM